MTRVPLTHITFDAGTQVRAALDTTLVAEYAQAMTDGDVFPPVVLFHDGNRYYLADGFHRVMAAQRNDLRDLPAEVRPGTQQDALWFALGANRKNGKRLNESDKRHAIVLALQAWPERSQRQIAEQIGCDQAWVSKVRGEVMTTHQLPSHVTGRDGKRYPATRPSGRPTPAPAPAAAAPRTRAAQAAHVARLRQMAEEGYSSRQMAVAVGRSLESLRESLRYHQIAVPADKIIGRIRKHDANRIVDRTVLAAEHLTADVDLVDFGALDGARLPDWIQSLKTARRGLAAFIHRLEQEQQTRHSQEPQTHVETE